MRRIVIVILSLLSLNAPAVAVTYTRDGDMIGEITRYRIEPEETLYEIARRFDIGIVEMLAANPGVDPWTPTGGLELTLPTAHVLPPIRKGIVINLSELRLFYFPDAQTVMTYPIGIGKEGWETPTGKTTIIRKRKDPAWIPPEILREENPDLPEIILPGADNPLGQYAMNLGFTNYIIHGTNRPYGIGKRSSHGCIRLYPEDIEELFGEVSLGAPVAIIDTPYKLGWQGNQLLLEVTPTQEQSDIIAEYKIPDLLPIPEIESAIERKAKGWEVDWEAVTQTIMRRDGIPAIIAMRQPIE